MPDEDIRVRNQAVAAAYDAAPYDKPAQNGVEPRFILGVTALLGGKTHADGVLDLGCGAGNVLKAVAEQTTGPLVGVDISEASCELARRKLAGLGDRAKVIHADLLDLAPDDLGQFDIVYLIGLIYVAPSAVREKALSLAAQCLRPGGALVLTHYAGAAPLTRSWIHRLLKRYPAHADGIARTIAQLRADLGALRDELGDHPMTAMARVALSDLLRLPDQEFELEVFADNFDVLLTSELEALLSPHGVQFVAYLHGPFYSRESQSRRRAMKTDAFDLHLGGYRSAIFLKSDLERPFDLETPAILWGTPLPFRQAHEAPEDPYTTHTGASLTLHSPVMRAAIASMHETAKTFDELWDSVCAREPEALLPGARESLLSDMRELLKHANLRPIANPYFQP